MFSDKTKLIFVLQLIFMLMFNVETFVQAQITSDGSDDYIYSFENKDELSSSAQLQDTTSQVLDETWLTVALRDIAYYLRNYKFNSWDRRYYKNKPGEEFIGFYRTFPMPPLRPKHWKVYENCDTNFYNCVQFLNKVIDSIPMTRNDDIVTIFNDRQVPMNDKDLKKLNMLCKQALHNSEKSALPFDSMVEKFQWSITAAYYMCWYTMLETPALSMLGETCDNFANCLDEDIGAQHKDPRSDDRKAFSCATYSFCPDSCCPMKHVNSKTDCYESIENPCYSINVHSSSSHRRCYRNRKNNRNFKDMIENRWNVTCFCKDKGFVWESEYSICVDINECVTGAHRCNKSTEDCLNLPGSYECVCKWGYHYNDKHKNCIRTKKLFLDLQQKTHNSSVKHFLARMMEYFGF